jgi:hypothetical protein
MHTSKKKENYRKIFSMNIDKKSSIK